LASYAPVTAWILSGTGTRRRRAAIDGWTLSFQIFGIVMKKAFIRLRFIRVLSALLAAGIRSSRRSAIARGVLGNKVVEDRGGQDAGRGVGGQGLGPIRSGEARSSRPWWGNGGVGEETGAPISSWPRRVVYLDRDVDYVACQEPHTPSRPRSNSRLLGIGILSSPTCRLLASSLEPHERLPAQRSLDNGCLKFPPARAEN